MTALGFSDLRGRMVGVWGLGVEGRATLRRLAADGVVPAVLVDAHGGHTDDGREVLAADAAGLAALGACDVVVKSPGISPYDPPALEVAAGGADLVGGLALWLGDAPRERVVCITGTKGKSTTSAIAGALATGLGARCVVGGNLGTPPWDPQADLPADPDLVVVETSSYQAHDLRVGPRVAVVTSLSQDHLTWHHGYDTYVRDKLSLCTRPGVQVVLTPVGDPELERHADLLGPHRRTVPATRAAWTDALGVLGEHNLRNAALARAALVALGVPGADDDERLAAAATGYVPLRSRLTPVGSVDGVSFVDDSLSTNVLPTLAAVEAFPGRRIALLVGGQDRGIDYGPLALGLRDRSAGLLVLTLPDNGPRIAAAFAEHAPAVEVRAIDDLAEATAAAFAWARPGGVVLLSPAAPSFGRFRDYAERAEVFTAAVTRIAAAVDGI